MAKKKEKVKSEQSLLTEAVITDEGIVDTLRKNYMPYAMTVIISRAIPEIDGFKPAHRKLLYTMYQMGLLNSPRTKSSNIVGATMKLILTATRRFMKQWFVLQEETTRCFIRLSIQKVLSVSSIRIWHMPLPVIPKQSLTLFVMKYSPELTGMRLNFQDNYDGSIKRAGSFADSISEYTCFSKYGYRCRNGV